MTLRTLSSILLAGLLSIAVTLPVELSADQSPEAKKRFEETKVLAEKGYAEAQLYIGVCFYEGRLTPKDNAQAVFWFRKAAEQGNTTGQSYLAGCYSSGHGMPKDEVKANFWYRKAAEQGDSDAQVLLGFQYLGGRGAPKDQVEAYALWNLASDTNENTRKIRDILEKKLLPEEIMRGQQRTKEWQKLIEERQKAKAAGK